MDRLFEDEPPRPAPKPEGSAAVPLDRRGQGAGGAMPGPAAGATRASTQAPAAAHAPAGVPLSTRMRPHTLDEFVGQRQLLGEHSVLRRAIESGQPHSMILHGPPGTGKTTLARMVAAASGAAFEEESAVDAGRAEVRAVLARAAERRKLGQQTIFFLDEIHRFNKAQQDALLPAVEEGLVTFIGATTENPYFEVNSALLSRSRVYELEALSPQDVRTLLDRAVTQGELAGPGQSVTVDPEALAYAAEWTAGDARAALNGLELAAQSAGPDGHVTVATITDALQGRTIAYDRQADNHYDTISAWIKSTRGSDPDASLYYLAVMLEGGEDPRFIARRMVILAAEDVGNADPQALSVATAAAAAVDRIGLPEAHYPLAQAAVYLALAPKSNASGKALHAAREWVAAHGAQAPPGYLRSGSRAEGNYDNPHGNPGHLSAQEWLPPAVAGARFYEPDEAEARMRERLAEIRRARGRD